VKLFSAQRRRKTAKPLQFLELMKATFDCGGNARQCGCEAPAARKAIPEIIIVRSFKKRCISNTLDRSEDDIVWEGVVEDKGDSDWVESTDNNSVMSDDGESDE